MKQNNITTYYLKPLASQLLFHGHLLQTLSLQNFVDIMNIMISDILTVEEQIAFMQTCI